VLRRAVVLALVLFLSVYRVSAEELNNKQVQALIPYMLKMHLNQPRMDLVFMKRLVKEFMSQVDPGHAVYLQSEADAATAVSGPLRVHPTNPRYFTDDTGRALILTGSHTWQNLQDRGPIDPPAPLEKPARRGRLEKWCGRVVWCCDRPAFQRGAIRNPRGRLGEQGHLGECP
jgi:hypothetical protein